jgi:hypothetical protein
MCCSVPLRLSLRRNVGVDLPGACVGLPGRSYVPDWCNRSSVLVQLPYCAGLVQLPYCAGLVQLPYCAGLVQLPYCAGLVQLPFCAGLVQLPYCAGLVQLPYCAGLVQLPWPFYGDCMGRTPRRVSWRGSVCATRNEVAIGYNSPDSVATHAVYLYTRDACLIVRDYHGPTRGAPTGYYAIGDYAWSVSDFTLCSASPATQASMGTAGHWYGSSSSNRYQSARDRSGMGRCKDSKIAVDLTESIKGETVNHHQSSIDQTRG